MVSTVVNEIRQMLDEAEQLGRVKQWSDAAQVCERARALAPDNSVVLDKLGWYLSRARLYEEAAHIYADLSARQPGWAKWPYSVGYQFYEQGKWEEALIWFDRALKLRPDYLVVLYRKGYAHVRLDQVEQARWCFETCISVWRGLDSAKQVLEAKHYSDACFQLGKLLLAKGQSAQAEAVLFESVLHGPPDPYKHYNLGKALLRNEKAAEAREQFRKCQSLQPGRDFVAVYLARSHSLLQEFREAELTLQRVSPHYRKAYVWRELGRVYLLQQKLEQAIDCLRKAATMDPHNHNSYYLLGQAYEASPSPAGLSHAYVAYTTAVELRERHYKLDFPEARARLKELAAQGLQMSEVADSESHVGEVLDPGSRTHLGHVKGFAVSRGFGFIARSGESDIFWVSREVDTAGEVGFRLPLPLS